MLCRILHFYIILLIDPLLNVIMRSVIMLNVIMVSITLLCVSHFYTVRESAIVLTNVMLNFDLCIVMLSVIVLRVIILSAIILNVIMPSVVAPFREHKKTRKNRLKLQLFKLDILPKSVACSNGTFKCNKLERFHHCLTAPA